MPPPVPTARVEASEGMPLREALVRALREEGGGVAAVARRFGVSRVTVYAWMEREGITLGPRVIVE